MDIHQLIELLFGRFHEGRVDADPGIIDQKIEIVPLPVVPERILHVFHEDLEGFVIGDIELQGHRLAAHFLNLNNHRICFHFLAVVGQDNVMSLSSQMKGHAFAKTTASTSYDRDFHEGKILRKVFSHNGKCISAIGIR